ncbi:MAG: Unknown protein [uncultured Sulfurovum sp.]|uniref:Uncharacterized protein n=1 Tax=uncultured Sulfurovum sp. TaxID=269237 RepID=A0A6S6TGF7_9BACT|nr:MAG: Unknown protein [uncultured Sulfurovum sp.]
MQNNEKKSTIFLKILLITVVIFIGLGFYAYKMIKEDKENSQRNTSNVPTYTRIPHPPLTERDKEEVATKNETLKNDLNHSQEKNLTRTIPEGAEYISDEEQLEREKEANLSMFDNEEFYDDQIIPQDEIDNYKDAVTIPMPGNETVPTPISTNPFNNPSLGIPIPRQNGQKNQHPTLGTPIGNSPSSPF